jgi:hypothetical protein
MDSLLDQFSKKIAGAFTKTTEKESNSSVLFYGAIGICGSLGVATLYRSFKKHTNGKILYDRPCDMNSEERLGADEAQNLHHLRLGFVVVVCVCPSINISAEDEAAFRESCATVNIEMSKWFVYIVFMALYTSDEA